MNVERDQRISTHQDIIARLNVLNPEVEAYNMRISQFILGNPGLAGLPYSGVEILMKEKDPDVCLKAIKVIIEELRTRRDPDAPKYRFKYRVISESRVRKIIQECRPHAEAKTARSNLKPLLTEMICPHCNREIQCTLPKREEVVSFRGTAITDDAVIYLATALGVSRSLLVNTLLTVERRYGHALKEKP